MADWKRAPTPPAAVLTVPGLYPKRNAIDHRHASVGRFTVFHKHDSQAINRDYADIYRNTQIQMSSIAGATGTECNNVSHLDRTS